MSGADFVIVIAVLGLVLVAVIEIVAVEDSVAVIFDTFDAEKLKVDPDWVCGKNEMCRIVQVK